VQEDWRWVYKELGTDRFDLYGGQHIAVVGQRVLGSGPNTLLLRQRVAAEQHLHPERIVITYIEGW
jgi:hypothetical protein